MNRRASIKKVLGSGVALSVAGATNSFGSQRLSPMSLKGNINHSVCKWCYGKIPLDTFAQDCRKIGIKSIELLGPEDWPTLKKYGLTCALASGAGMGIEKGFNDPKLHDELVASYEALFPKLQEAGYTQVICFSGNRKGMSDYDGMRNCAVGLRRLMPLAKKHNVTMVMELLNSKVNHKDYMCDHTAWGAGLCEMVGSENFKLLYDIYHMQIMEGDVIASINQYHQYISHYHTGGVPGRNEIDDSQELNYPAIMKAIKANGFKGYVAQEFIPKRDPISSLRQGVEICDI
ncbi:hydroxypyruvate isomerase [Dyadobacter jejuensis]|uniref:Hydroxypyruvate isomerase n=1 Tax=Dyadobacter jejuensis TaxID=1082580 RepID=A0A316AP78_9BACT|nr:TIM barrel protein [Dyadobacter jejuensis]PWJ58944.1 hydroxypyruvate isomerase [Dyadobacter jejuensis]